VTKQPSDRSGSPDTTVSEKSDFDQSSSTQISYSPLVFVISGVVLAAVVRVGGGLISSFAVPLTLISFFLYVIGAILGVKYMWLSVATDQLSIRDLHGSGGIGGGGYVCYYLTASEVDGIPTLFLVVLLLAIALYVFILSISFLKIESFETCYI
jgi:hypothetical protein